MALALYRKYRPQRFSELVGNTHIRTTLENQLKLDRLSHAYLFAGPRGLGKTTTARLLAKAVNCLKRPAGEAEPCNSCRPCQEITAGRSLDIIEIDAASHTGVDHVREVIINDLPFGPQKNKFKIFIIDEAHMLSLSAFNALLKTLEEPPTHTIFILATTEAGQLPETIISRCQRFNFARVTTEEVVKLLKLVCRREGRQVSTEVINQIAITADGYLRDALSWLEQVLTIVSKEVTLQEASLVLVPPPYLEIGVLLDFIKKADYNNLLTKANQIIEIEVDVAKFLQDVTEYLRELISVKYSTSQQLKLFSQEVQNNLKRQAKELTEDNLLKLIDIFLKRQESVKRLSNPRIGLELALLEAVQVFIPLQNFKRQLDDSNKSSDSSTNTSNPSSIGNEGLTNTTQQVNEPTNQQAHFSVKQDFQDMSASQLKLAKQNKQVINNKREHSLTKDVSLKLSEIKEKWDKVWARLVEKNHSLSVAFKMAQPVAIDDNTLTLGFVYEFYSEIIQQDKNRCLLEEVWQEVIGKRLKIKTAKVNDSQAINALNKKEK